MDANSESDWRDPFNFFTSDEDRSEIDDLLVRPLRDPDDPIRSESDLHAVSAPSLALTSERDDLSVMIGGAEDIEWQPEPLSAAYQPSEGGSVLSAGLLAAPGRVYTREFVKANWLSFKVMIQECIRRNESLKCLQKKFSFISRKNLVRWLMFGTQRKKGAGRKTSDPDREQDILSWCRATIRATGGLTRSHPQAG